MKRVIIHPFVLAVFPIFSLLNHNTDELPLQEAIPPAAMAFAATILLWCTVSLLLRNKHKAAILASVAAILFFSFGHALNALRSILYSQGLLRDFGPYLESMAGQLVLLIIWSALFSAAAYLIRKTTSDLRSVSLFFDIYAVALLLILTVDWSSRRYDESAVVAYSNAWRQQIRSGDTPEGVSSPPGLRRSVYYIILDGYARQDILRTIYALDNSRFYSFLTQKGFYIAEQSTSNYAQTPLSIASSLNSIYLDELVSQVGDQTTSRLPLIAMTQDSRLSSKLRNYGYASVAFSSGSPLTEIKTADVYLSSAGGLSGFENAILNTTPLPLLLRLPFFESQFDLHRKRILYALDHLADADQSQAPAFVFAHIMAPHPPFVFGAHGEPINSEMPFDFLDGSQYTALTSEREYTEAYRNQVTFVTDRIEQVIEKLVSRPEPPIIILQADHGPGSRLDWTGIKNTDLGERMSILNALYFPDQDYRNLYPSITPVNTFRVVLNQYYGIDLPKVQDKNYFSTLDRPYAFTDVTGRIERPQ